MTKKRKPTIKIDVEVLHQLLEYNQDTGKVVWKTRPLEHTHWGQASAKGFNTRSAGKEAGSVRELKSGKRVELKLPTLEGSKTFLLTRVVWAMMTGGWPNDDEYINHLDGDGTNLSWSNLHKSSPSDIQRTTKTRKDNVSGEVGIAQDKATGRWKWKVMVEGVTYRGTTDTLEEAKEAKREKEL